MEEREAVLRGVVEEFDEVGFGGDGGGNGADGGTSQRGGLMREVGRRYGEVLGEIEMVKAEMGRLQVAGGVGKRKGVGRGRMGGAEG